MIPLPGILPYVMLIFVGSLVDLDPAGSTLRHIRSGDSAHSRSPAEKYAQASCPMFQI